MAYERLCIIVNNDYMSLELKVAVKEFLLNFFIENEVKYFKLDDGITGGKKEVFVIPNSIDAKRFLQWVDDRRLGYPKEVDALGNTGWVEEPEGRSFTSYNDFDGLHTYVQGGDALNGLRRSFHLGVQTHGAWLHNAPAARYMGKVERLWFVGDSTNVYNCSRQLAYDLRRPRKTPETPLCLENYLEPAIKRLNANTKLCVMTERGDFYTVTTKGVTVGEFAPAEVILQAAVHGYRKFKHEFHAADTKVFEHGLSNRESQFRQAAHIAAIDRNQRGFV